MTGRFHQEQALQVVQMEEAKAKKLLIGIGEYRDVGTMTHADETHTLM